jgi:hypothetical protein
VLHRQVRQRAVHLGLLVRRGAAERILGGTHHGFGDVRQGAIEVELLEGLAVVGEGRGGEDGEGHCGDKAFHDRFPFS